MGFCLYVAAGIFIQDQRGDKGNAQSITNLEFILAAMKAIGNRHSITNHFTAQLEIDIESSGIRTHSKPTGKGGIPNTPINGLNPSRGGVPMSVNDLRYFSDASTSYTGKDGKANIQEVCSYITSLAKGSQIDQASLRPFYGILPRKPHNTKEVHRPPEGLREKHVHPSFPNWNPPANSALDESPNLNQNTRHQQQQQRPLESRGFALSNPPIPADPNPVSAGSPFNIDSFLAGNTPSSDSSSSNTMQVPYRQADSSSHNKSTDHAMFQADSNSFITASDWTSDIPFNTEPLDGMYGMPRDQQARPLQAQEDQFFPDIEGWAKNPAPPGG